MIDQYLTVDKKLASNDQESKYLKHETIKVLEESMGEFFFILGIKKGFLTMTQNPEAVKD